MLCLNLNFDGNLVGETDIIWSKDYFDMLYVIIEAMEGEEIAIFA